jgi:hypothetical protein
MLDAATIGNWAVGMVWQDAATRAALTRRRKKIRRIMAQGRHKVLQEQKQWTMN